MTENNLTLSQITQLKQKLHDAKVALDELNTDRDNKLHSLVRLISHLSLACKGQNLVLDNMLAKLRQQLSSSTNLEQAQPLFLDIERGLKSHYQQMSGQLDKSRLKLGEGARKLQRIDSIPEQLKKEISYFKEDISKPLHSTWDYLPKAEQLISFYDDILTPHLLKSSPIALQPKHKQLALELVQMISNIEFRTEQRQQVIAIKATLEQDIDIDRLLESYHSILNMLLENINREKSASQEFLYSLNNTLATVREVISDSFQHTERTYQLTHQLNQEINTRVGHIGGVITVTDDIVQLKAQINEQLQELRTALSRKETLEQRELTMARKAMESLRQELNTLSNEASTYRERLIEQQRLSLLDSLTQLPNRAALEERMELAFRNFQRNKRPLWVVVADIDHFKSINDSFGHSTGDKALQVIAMALKNSLRESEFIARYGGEEFVLLIPDVSATDIAQLLNRVKEKVKNIPFKFKNQRITVTLSVGAACITERELIQATFERADAALYQAKREGRDKVIIDI